MVEKIISKIKNSYKLKKIEVTNSNSFFIETAPESLYSLLEFLRFMDFGEFETLCGISKNSKNNYISYILFSHELKLFLIVSSVINHEKINSVLGFWKNASVFEEGLEIDLW